MKRLLSAAAATAAALALAVFVPASPAQASPTCYTSVKLWMQYTLGPASVPSAGTSAASTTCNMVQGNVSSAVSTLQNTLNRCYFYYHGPSTLFPAALTVDGNFGAKTRNALKFAQGIEGASVDGVYGPQSRDRLFHWWAIDRDSGCQRIIQPPSLWY